MKRQDKQVAKIAIFMSLLGCGAGQLYNQQVLKGVIFVLIGTLFNYKANLNQSIIYSFTGNIDLARKTLHYGWGLNYMSAFFFAMWDAYYIGYTKLQSYPPPSITAIPFGTAVMFGDIGVFYEFILGIGPIFGGIIGSLIGIYIGCLVKKLIKKRVNCL